MLPPGRSYSEIAGTIRRNISLNEAVERDARFFADRLAKTFSKYVEEALVDKLAKDKEEHGPNYTAEEFNAVQDRFIEQKLREFEMLQSGQITREELDDGKERTLEENK